MNHGAAYNELDPAACAVLRELIARNVIAPGVVLEASIKDLTANDLRGFSQVHLFAGAGCWSVAARLAGWPDDKPLWTASCPCQPFSAAGKGAGVLDPRHLWPDVFRLVGQLNPRTLVGEQVSGAAGYGWLDGVRADLEGEGYACEAVDIPALAVNAPHQRNRLYWVAMADASIRERQRDDNRHGSRRAGSDDEDVEHAAGERRGEGWPEHELRGGRPAASGADVRGAVGDAIGAGLEGQRGNEPGASEGWSKPDGFATASNHWADTYWIECAGRKSRGRRLSRFVYSALKG